MTKITSDTKVCKICNEEKEKSEFPDGQKMCKRCYSKSRNEWNKANREKTIKYKAKYRKTLKSRIYNARQSQELRAGKLTEFDDLNEKDLKQILTEQEGKCVRCHKEFTEDNDYQIAHVVSPLKGGYLNYYNIQLLCKSCNSKQGTKSIMWGFNLGVMLAKMFGG